MKTSATVLGLLTLLALTFGTPCMAETPTTTPPVALTAAPAPMDAVEFLATLAGDQSEAPGLEVLPPSPRFLSTVCTSHADCPAGQLCCYPCGIDGCDFVCMTAVRNRCPFFPAAR